MQLYKKILVTIDCSEVDEIIVNHVAQLAKIHGSTVCLIHAIHAHTLDENNALSERALKCIRQYTAIFQKNSVESQTLIRNGEPYPVIAAEIGSGDYDLVAMATHGHGVIGDFLFGSVSDKLKHTIDLPLLLIKA